MTNAYVSFVWLMINLQKFKRMQHRVRIRSGVYLKYPLFYTRNMQVSVALITQLR